MFTPVVIRNIAATPESYTSLLSRLQAALQGGVEHGSTSFRRFLSAALRRRKQSLNDSEARMLSNEANFIWNTKVNPPKSQSKTSSGGSWFTRLLSGSPTPAPNTGIGIHVDEAALRAIPNPNSATWGLFNTSAFNAPTRVDSGISSSAKEVDFTSDTPESSNTSSGNNFVQRAVASVGSALEGFTDPRNINTWLRYTAMYQQMSKSAIIRALTSDDLLHFFKIEAGKHLQGSKINNTVIGGYNKKYCGPFQMGQPFWNEGVKQAKLQGKWVNGLGIYKTWQSLIDATRAGHAAADPKLACLVWVMAISEDAARFDSLLRNLPSQYYKNMIYLLHNLGSGHAQNLFYMFGLSGSKSRYTGLGNTAYAFAAQLPKDGSIGLAIRSHHKIFAALGGPASEGDFVRKVYQYAGPNGRGLFRARARKYIR